MHFARSKTNLNQEGEHVVTEVRVRVVQILDHAFGPLKTLLAERAPAVQRHDRGQVLQLHALVGAQLKQGIHNGR